MVMFSHFPSPICQPRPSRPLRPGVPIDNVPLMQMIEGAQHTSRVKLGLALRRGEGIFLMRPSHHEHSSQVKEEFSKPLKPACYYVVESKSKGPLRRTAYQFDGQISYVWLLMVPEAIVAAWP